MDSSDNPHISYYDVTNGALKYAWYDGTWHTETVDSGYRVGKSTSLTLDSGGNPHISYFDLTNADLKYAWYDGTWHTETVDSMGDVGYSISLALDSSDHPHISYSDHNNDDLKYAFLPCTNDFDCDGILDNDDNCFTISNPTQADTFPPQGNGIGDACDCEANFDCDQDVDANDVTAFLTDFGRSIYNRPCTNEDQCKGDFSCDGDVDAQDVTKFLEDFGRSQYNNPCPVCQVGEWCVYQVNSLK